jgi:2-methylcitrate dehydratase PrpD
MDKILDLLSEYTISLEFEDLPKELIHEAKRRIIDSFGCAVGGFLGKPTKIIRELVERSQINIAIFFWYMA